MSKVTVSLNGRSFTMGCEEGQEAYLTELAQDLDARVRGISEQVGQIGDLRLLLMASLVLADELREARRRTDAAEALTDRLRADGDSADDRRAEDRADIAARLLKAAERLERIAEDAEAVVDDGTQPPAEARA
jgi:cell division protein ZapA